MRHRPQAFFYLLTQSSELDKSRSSNKKPLLGGSLFGSSSGPSAPPEIQPLVSLQIAVSKAAATTTSAVPTAEAEYDKLNDPSKPTPTPPVHAARLSALVKSLASAESAVSESIKARRNLIEGLEKIIETNRAALATEEAQKDVLTTRKIFTEAKKRDVEDGIMRGLSAESTPVAAHGSPISGSKTNGSSISPMDSASVEPERPHVEELTPPPPESGTEEPTASTDPATITTTTNTINQAPTPFSSDPRLAGHSPHPPSSSATPHPQPTAGADLLSSLSMPQIRPYAGLELNHSPQAKKRKLGNDDYPDFGGGEDAMADLDEDVAELLRAESRGV